jgi:hypothetical protein
VVPPKDISEKKDVYGRDKDICGGEYGRDK